MILLAVVAHAQIGAGRFRVEVQAGQSKKGGPIVWGYLYTGFMSLGQTYFARLRFGVNAPEMRPATSGAPGF